MIAAMSSINLSIDNNLTGFQQIKDILDQKLKVKISDEVGESISKCRDYLDKKIEFINTFPLNTNGKTDRNKLRQLIYNVK